MGALPECDRVGGGRADLGRAALPRPQGLEPGVQSVSRSTRTVL